MDETNEDPCQGSSKERTHNRNHCIVPARAAFLPRGNKECVMRGPKSRAGFIAYPVVPSSDRPIAHTSTPTRNGPRAAAGPNNATFFEKIAATTVTRTNVPIVSLSKFAPKFQMAGEVERHASFKLGSKIEFHEHHEFAPAESVSNLILQFSENPCTLPNPSKRS